MYIEKKNEHYGYFEWDNYDFDQWPEYSLKNHLVTLAKHFPQTMCVFAQPKIICDILADYAPAVSFVFLFFYFYFFFIFYLKKKETTSDSSNSNDTKANVSIILDETNERANSNWFWRNSNCKQFIWKATAAAAAIIYCR